MRKITFLLLAVMCAGTVFSQTPPNWLDPASRERNYPNSVFITGYTPGNVRAGETKSDAEARLRKDALAYVTEGIRVQVNSEKQKRDERTKTQISGKEESEQILSVFESTVKTSTSLDLAGVKTDSYCDDTKGLIYAFAWVNKYELTGYYNALLNTNMDNLESALKTAKALESSGEKAKARTEYEKAVSLLTKTEQAQDVLVALGNSSQSDKTANYRSDIILALARLSQGVYIYVQSSEDIFGKSTTLISSGVKSILSKNGCSFTSDVSQADFILKLNASANEISNSNGIFFSYAEVTVELIKTQSGKTIYEEVFSRSQGTKEGGTSYQNAANEAFKKTGKLVAEKLIEWVK